VPSLYFLCPDACLWRKMTSLNFWTLLTYMPYILTCSQTQLNKPCQFRYFMCSRSSTPGATNKALDLLHQVCLKQHLFSRFVRLWGILFRGLNNFETAGGWTILRPQIKSCNFSWILGKPIGTFVVLTVELFQLLLIDLFIANS